MSFDNILLCMEKNIKTLICAAMIFFATSFVFARNYPDNTYQPIPEDYYTKLENEGKVIRYVYETRNPFQGDKKVYKKSALVYLPYGYDENARCDKYNVLYLMHGGSQTPEWYFNGANSGSLMKSLLDHLHAEEKVHNLIVCAVTYNTGYNKDEWSCANRFYQELLTELMPDFEKKFHIIKNRYHRGFGGFSMGAMTTWNIFDHCLPEIANYLPVSGDARGAGGGSNGMVTAKYLEKMVKDQGYTKNDFKIYAGCGAHEIATPNLVPQIEAMKKTETFVYSENFATGNFYFILCEDSGHDQVTVLRTLYNGLPKMF